MTALALLAPALLFAQGADADREAEMFGGSAPEPISATIVHAIAQRDQSLDIGGDVYLRGQLAVLHEPANSDDLQLQNPNLLRLFLDARPSDRVRAFARGRLDFDPTVGAGATDLLGNPRRPLNLNLDQLWLNFDILRTVFVTVGRQPIRWGSGRFWNPSDFVNQQRRDPLALLDERLGADMVKLHLPIEAWGWNFYAVANVDDATTFKHLGGALRAEFLFGPTELALAVAARQDTPLRLSVDVSSGAGPLDLHLEGVAYRGDRTPSWQGRFAPADFVIPRKVDREDDWIAQLDGGAELQFLYSEQDSIYLGVELFLNQAGYNGAELYPWLALNGQYTSFYLGRTYLAAYASAPQPGDWNNSTLTLSAISNLSDRTAIVRFDWQVTLLTFLEASAFAAVFLGDAGEFHFSLDVPPSPIDPRLANGISVRATDYLVGLWLTLKF